MIIAGPCLIDDQDDIENAYKTADGLQEIDPLVRFRAKVWGGGLNPEIYFPGIGLQGVGVLNKIRELTGLNVGTEVQSSERLPHVAGNLNFIWIAARVMQSYGLLIEVGKFAGNFERIIIKRHFGATGEEAWGIHDICRRKLGYKPMICERGVNSFHQEGTSRWIPDFRFMADTIRERPDIDLMFDACHSTFNRDNVLPMVKAALAIGVRNFMFEVYANPEKTRVDKQHALSLDDFARIRDAIGEA